MSKQHPESNYAPREAYRASSATTVPTKQNGIQQNTAPSTANNDVVSFGTVSVPKNVLEIILAKLDSLESEVSGLKKFINTTTVQSSADSSNSQQQQISIQRALSASFTNNKAISPPSGTFLLLAPNYEPIANRYLFVDKGPYIKLRELEQLSSSSSPFDKKLSTLRKKCQRLDNALLSPSKRKLEQLVLKKDLDLTNEVWKDSSVHSINALQNYLENTFKRVVEEGKVLGGFHNYKLNSSTTDLVVMIWNTGLQTIYNEELYCIVTKNNTFVKPSSTGSSSNSSSNSNYNGNIEEITIDDDDESDGNSVVFGGADLPPQLADENNYMREYILADFLTASGITSSQNFYSFLNCIDRVWPREQQLEAKTTVEQLLPPKADYFSGEKAERIVFCSCVPIKPFETINKKHLVENRMRLPPKYKSMREQVLVDKVETAARAVVKRAVRNPRLAIPQLYRANGINKGEMQLLLPINIENPIDSTADAAVVMRLTDTETSALKQYEITTVLDLRVAFNNARLVCKIDQDWLLKGYEQSSSAPNTTLSSSSPPRSQTYAPPADHYEPPVSSSSPPPQQQRHVTPELSFHSTQRRYNEPEPNYQAAQQHQPKSNYHSPRRHRTSRASSPAVLPGPHSSSSSSSSSSSAYPSHSREVSYSRIPSSQTLPQPHHAQQQRQFNPYSSNREPEFYPPPSEHGGMAYSPPRSSRAVSPSTHRLPPNASYHSAPIHYSPPSASVYLPPSHSRPPAYSEYEPPRKKHRK